MANGRPYLAATRGAVKSVAEYFILDLAFERVAREREYASSHAIARSFDVCLSSI